MKMLIKGFVMAVCCTVLMSCNNDKPAENAASVASAAQPTASATPPATDGAANAAPTTIAQPTATPAPTAAPTATATTKAVETVKPTTAQTTPAPAQAGSAKTTTIKFDELTHDWGSIKEGEKMTHIFKFKNTGSNDLIISDARGSCGCTVPEWPKEPIKAGKTGELKVVFDSNGKPGAQSKTVTVTANTDPANTMLVIKGNVKEKAAETK
jgi:hypothetical protein